MANENSKIKETLKTWGLIITFLTSVVLGYANLKNQIDITSAMACENKEKIEQIRLQLSILDEIRFNLKNICDKLEVKYQEK